MTHLKFRAFQKSTQKMLYSLSLKKICTTSPRLTEEEFDDLIIMQSTGLTDKNGKEIFEGDIIQDDDDDERFRYVVEYVSSSFMLKGKNGKYEMSELFPSDAVIGNIYENHELINY